MSNLSDHLSDRDEIERLRREVAEQEWRSAVDRLIDEAQKKGTFDNLPGKGRPLNLKKNPYAPEQSLAYDLLQNNDYTLPWIAERKEILEEIATFRADLGQRWRMQLARRRGTLSPAGEADLRQEWGEFVQEMGERLHALNAAIANTNLIIPVDRLEILKLNLDRELERIGAEPL